MVKEEPLQLTQLVARRPPELPVVLAHQLREIRQQRAVAAGRKQSRTAQGASREAAEAAVRSLPSTPLSIG